MFCSYSHWMNAFNDYIKCLLQQLRTADITCCYGNRRDAGNMFLPGHANCIIIGNVIRMLTKDKQLNMPAEKQLPRNQHSKQITQKQTDKTIHGNGYVLMSTYNKSPEAMKFKRFNQNIVSQEIFITDKFMDSFSWLYNASNLSL